MLINSSRILETTTHLLIELDFCSKFMYIVKVLITLVRQNESKFPPGVIPLENDIFQRHQLMAGHTPTSARYNYIRYVKTLWHPSEEGFVKVCIFFVIMSKEFQGSKINAGVFDVFARGITSIDFLKKTRYRLEIKGVEKAVIFKEAESNKVLFVLRDLSQAPLRLEKNVEDNKVLSIHGCKEESGERSCEITFQSHVEREYFYLALHNLMDTPTYRRLSIFVGSWNMGSAAPPPLDAWIPSPSREMAFDMYVIGLQVSFKFRCKISKPCAGGKMEKRRN